MSDNKSKEIVNLEGNGEATIKAGYAGKVTTNVAKNGKVTYKIGDFEFSKDKLDSFFSGSIWNENGRTRVIPITSEIEGKLLLNVLQAYLKSLTQDERISLNGRIRGWFDYGALFDPKGFNWEDSGINSVFCNTRGFRFFDLNENIFHIKNDEGYWNGERHYSYKVRPKNEYGFAYLYDLLNTGIPEDADAMTAISKLYADQELLGLKTVQQGYVMGLQSDVYAKELVDQLDGRVRRLEDYVNDRKAEERQLKEYLSDMASKRAWANTKVNYYGSPPFPSGELSRVGMMEQALYLEPKEGY